MSAFAALQALIGQTFRTPEGTSYQLIFHPGCSQAEIAQFEASLPCPLPADIREMLAFCRGFEGSPIGRFVFMGDDGVQFDPFGRVVDFGPDDAGNYWVVDLTPESKDFGPVYFLSHDPPAVAYECATLADFLIELKQMGESPERNAIDEMLNERIWTIWEENPGLIPQPKAAAASDRELRSFAQTLEPDWLISDLRDPKPGDGFSWGRKGIGGIVRFGNRPLFAYRVEPKRGLMQRLLGRKP